MKEAFLFLDRVAREPEQDEDGIATVTLSEAQWAVKIAIKEILEELVGIQSDLMVGYVHKKLDFINNKKNKIKDIDNDLKQYFYEC